MVLTWDLAVKDYTATSDLFDFCFTLLLSRECPRSGESKMFNGPYHSNILH